MDAIAVGFGFEKPPDDLDSHCTPAAVLFNRFDLSLELYGLAVAGSEQLVESALESEVPAIQHLWIDVAPNFVEVRDFQYMAVKVGHARNRNACRYPGTAALGLIRNGRVRFWGNGRVVPGVQLGLEQGAG